MKYLKKLKCWKIWNLKLENNSMMIIINSMLNNLKSEKLHICKEFRKNWNGRKEKNNRKSKIGLGKKNKNKKELGYRKKSKKELGYRKKSKKG